MLGRSITEHLGREYDVSTKESPWTILLIVYGEGGESVAMERIWVLESRKCGKTARMKNRIYKYPLKIVENQAISLPRGSQILSVAGQQGSLCLWAQVPVDDDGHAHDYENRTIEIVRTGESISLLGLKFIGTVIMKSYVWHVFEKVG